VHADVPLAAQIADLDAAGPTTNHDKEPILMPTSPEPLFALLAILVVAWLSWRAASGFARLLAGAIAATALVGVGGCGVPGSSDAGGASKNSRTGTVTRVVDGDTVHVSIGGADETVRVLGVSAPETKKRRDCGGPEATALMRRLAPAGSNVTVTTNVATGDKRDVYRRLLAYLDVRGDDVGEQIIRAGRATVYSFRGRQFSRIKRYQAAEKAARNARRGSWATCPGFDSRR
jgi:micrococcal nuclease